MRPVLVIGNGVHSAKAEDVCRKLVDHWGIPVVSSWLGADIVPTDHPLYIGRFGIFGDRASNFVVQNADLLIVIGSRLSIPQTGHRVEHFAREAKIITINEDAAGFISHHLGAKAINKSFGWTKLCMDWKMLYQISEEKREPGNSFEFIENLSHALPNDAIIVTDMGTAFTCTFQSAKMKLGQRWFTASGHAPMGYGLPGAIGAHYATGKRVWCIVGDGGIMFNLQELQTIAENKLPIRIILLDNGGYLTMKHTQANHFGRFVGSKFKFPDWAKLFSVFGITDYEIVKLDPMQPLIPRSSSVKLPDGSITSRPIEDLYPFLSRDEFKANMIVPTVEVF